MRTHIVQVPEMTETLYRLVFEGDLLPGHQQAGVQPKLAELFGVDARKAGKLFSGKQHKVKTNLTIKQAKKYARAFAKLGALAYIEQDVVEPAQPARTEKTEPEVAVEPVEPAKPEEVKFTETGSFDVSAVRAFFEKQEAQMAENDKSSRHELFSLDEVDEQLASRQSDDIESSGVRNVLSPDQIAGMLKEKSA